MEAEAPQVLDFISLTGADTDVARHYLEAFNWNSSSAIDAYFENAPSQLQTPNVSSSVEPHPLSDSGDIFEDPSGVDDTEQGSGEAGEEPMVLGRASSPAASFEGESNDDSFHSPMHLSASPPTEAESSFFGPQRSQQQQQQRALPDDFPEGFGHSDLHEAQMLEAALLNVPFTGNLSEMMMPAHEPAQPRAPSPSTLEARALREQQDLEYQESVRRDREKREAEVFAAQQREQEVEALSRLLTHKRSTLSEEPGEDDPDALIVAVRLPNGVRCQRRFKRSDPVARLYDFVDVEANTQRDGCNAETQHWWRINGYDLATPYPKRVIKGDDTKMTLEAVGLNNKQETLFVEMK